ncbi:helix-turn-helix transcriptional regulator [Kribbella sp. CCNWLY201]|uniref:helix-turn-helix transcriptional regulator n=1 Tax=unclassified Kribbella TaxID=2644121 RepID=UPI003FA54A24
MDWTEDSTRRFYLEAGSRIRHARKLHGWNQYDLASAVGLTRSSIANIEAGRQRAPIHIVALIARSLESSIDALLPSVADVERIDVSQADDLDLNGQAESAQDFVNSIVRRAGGVGP